MVFCCGDVKENLPTDTLQPLGKPVQLVHCVDTDPMHDALTGGSVTACLHFINSTPIDWFSKKQSMVETVTYSSEFVATRTCVVDLYTTLGCLGVQVNQKSHMFGDNELVVNSCSMLHAKSHK